MANYLLAYKGGGMAQTDAEREAAMAAWGAWFGGLGAAVVDAGNPFGPSKSVASDGTPSDGASSSLTGYTVVSAASLDAAAALTKGCPIFAAGGSVDVYETVPVM
jgi:YCII-related domain